MRPSSESVWDRRRTAACQMPGLFFEGAFSRRPRRARRQPVDRLQGHSDLRSRDTVAARSTNSRVERQRHSVTGAPNSAVDPPGSASMDRLKQRR